MKQPIFMNHLIFLTMILSSIMVISSTNMFMAWFSLELNLFSFTPILLGKMMMKETTATISYFLAQALGSSLFLMSNMFMASSSWIMKLNFLIISSSMLLKMGAAPYHFWYPMVMETTNWHNCLLLSTWQKLAPMFMLMFILLPKSKISMMLLIAPLNSMMGGLMGLSQTSMKKIMAYSSITHMGWMLSTSITETPCMFMIYLTIYSLIIVPMFIMFYNSEISKINHLWSSQKMPPTLMITASILLLSLGGMPPLTGFIPKLMIMKAMMYTSNTMLIMLIMGSLMNLFFYMNISLTMLMSVKKLNNFSKFHQNSTMLLLALNLLTPLIIML